MASQRIRPINQQNETPGECVIYHMSRDQRVRDNFALVAAQDYALLKKTPLLVVFNLFTQPTIRLIQQYRFMIEGLQEVEKILEKYNLPLLLLLGDPVENIITTCNKFKASALFLDFSPLREAVTSRYTLAQKLTIPVFEVDANNVVPLWIASDKEEFSAKTIRTKIHKHLPTFFGEMKQIVKHPFAGKGTFHNNWEAALTTIQAEEPPFYNPPYKPGEAAAHKQLTHFITNNLARYEKDRNKPDLDILSGLSPYFHYGQISTLRANLEVHKALKNDSELRPSAEAFLEESIVRRELAQNFCYYNKNYKSIDGGREWAKRTLTAHENDKRDQLYSLTQLERAETYDDAWNAAQKEMMITGKMHGYMRMYWAKKILEWSANAQEAIDKAVYLNDKYHLDGYEASGYVGILWAIAGVHDRPWFERPVFGSIRFMNFNGLKRKFKIDAYIQKWISHTVT